MIIESFSRLCVSLAELARAYAVQARKGAYDLAVALLLASLGAGLLSAAFLLLLAALTLVLRRSLGLEWALLIDGLACGAGAWVFALLARKRLAASGRPES